MPSVRSCQKLPLSHRANASSSRMDLPQAKAEPSSDGGNATGTRGLRRGTKTLVTLAGEKKISAEGGGGCAACGEVPGPAGVKPPPSGSHWACTNTSDVSRYL